MGPERRKAFIRMEAVFAIDCSRNGAKRSNAKPTTSVHPLRRIRQGDYHVTRHQTTQESVRSFLLTDREIMLILSLGVFMIA